MKKIKLTKRKWAIVDKEDFEWLSQWNWHITSHCYAKTSSNPQQYMHRMVNKTPAGLITDHINKNTLDNRKSNLRIADKRINSINRGLQSNNKSGCKGVSWSKCTKKWESYIWNYQKKITLGYFLNINDAIFARKKAEQKYHAI